MLNSDESFWKKGHLDSCLLPKSLTFRGQTEFVCFSNAGLNPLRCLCRFGFVLRLEFFYWADAAENVLNLFFSFERNSLLEEF